MENTKVKIKKAIKRYWKPVLGTGIVIVASLYAGIEHKEKIRYKQNYDLLWDNLKNIQRQIGFDITENKIGGSTLYTQELQMEDVVNTFDVPERFNTDCISTAVLAIVTPNYDKGLV